MDYNITIFIIPTFFYIFIVSMIILMIRCNFKRTKRIEEKIKYYKKMALERAEFSQKDIQNTIVNYSTILSDTRYSIHSTFDLKTPRERYYVQQTFEIFWLNYLILKLERHIASKKGKSEIIREDLLENCSYPYEKLKKLPHYEDMSDDYTMRMIALIIAFDKQFDDKSHSITSDSISNSSIDNEKFSHSHSDHDNSGTSGDSGSDGGGGGGGDGGGD